MKKEKNGILVILNIMNIIIGLWITLSCLGMKTIEYRNILIGGIISLSIGIVLFFIIWSELPLDYVEY
ncbi:MAG: hypothetical protein PHX78_00335 [bacterium]|nr:hypothetical protein [bacterium]